MFFTYEYRFNDCGASRLTAINPAGSAVLHLPNCEEYCRNHV